MRAAALLRPGARWLLAVVLAGALAGCGVTAPRGSDGYADLDSLGVADTDRVLTLSIGPALLRFAAAHVEDDPETRELLRSLDGVRIRIYEIDGDAARVAQRMGGISRKLQAQGWEQVLLARSGGEEAHMLMKVVDSYFSQMHPEVAAIRLAKAQEAGLEKISFAWLGSTDKGQRYYYRVQGPTFLIEHNNTQGNGNHIHSVWRDFNGDFGRDLLREHVASVTH